MGTCLSSATRMETWRAWLPFTHTLVSVRRELMLMVFVMDLLLYGHPKVILRRGCTRLANCTGLLPSSVTMETRKKDATCQADWMGQQSITTALAGRWRPGSTRTENLMARQQFSTQTAARR